MTVPEGPLETSLLKSGGYPAGLDATQQGAAGRGQEQVSWMGSCGCWVWPSWDSAPSTAPAGTSPPRALAHPSSSRVLSLHPQPLAQEAILSPRACSAPEVTPGDPVLSTPTAARVSDPLSHRRVTGSGGSATQAGCGLQAFLSFSSAWGSDPLVHTTQRQPGAERRVPEAWGRHRRESWWSWRTPAVMYS